MTDGLDQALVDAGLNLLRADVGPPALVVFDGEVPNPRPPLPYVLVYTIVAWPDNPDVQSLDGLTKQAVVRWYCHCVGTTQRASRGIAQRVRTALLNQRPAIADMNVDLIREDIEASPPVRNEATGVTVFDSVSVYKLTANK